MFTFDALNVWVRCFKLNRCIVALLLCCIVALLHFEKRRAIFADGPLLCYESLGEKAASFSFDLCTSFCIGQSLQANSLRHLKQMGLIVYDVPHVTLPSSSMTTLIISFFLIAILIPLSPRRHTPVR